MSFEEVRTLLIVVNIGLAIVCLFTFGGRRVAFVVLGAVALTLVSFVGPAAAHSGHWCGHTTHGWDWNTREKFVSSYGATSAYHWHYRERQELTILGWRWYATLSPRLCGPH